MSYDYFLTRLRNPPILSLREFDSANSSVDFGYSMSEVRDELDKIYPSAEGQWEYNDTNYKGDHSPSMCGQVLDMQGRFEFIINIVPVPSIIIRGSHHVNQINEVIRIAKILRLSAFDVQTGERIYLQPA